MTDREQIYDLMIRYGRAVDDHDVGLLRTCFTDDVIVDYKGAMDRPREGLEDFVDFFHSGLTSMGCTHHYSNFTFDIDGDTGSYSCLAIAQHWPRGAGMAGGPFVMAGTRYRNSVRRTADGWRICHARQEGLWLEGDVSVISHVRAEEAQAPSAP